MISEQPVRYLWWQHVNHQDTPPSHAPRPTTPRKPFFGSKTIQKHVSPFNFTGRWRGRGSCRAHASAAKPRHLSNSILLVTVVYKWPHHLLSISKLFRLSISRSRRLSISFPCSFIVVVCFMELLPNDLVTQIILRCIKDEPSFVSWSFVIGSAAPSGASATWMRYS
jgi:hypothetical protein